MHLTECRGGPHQALLWPWAAHCTIGAEAGGCSGIRGHGRACVGDTRQGMLRPLRGPMLAPRRLCTVLLIATHACT